MWEESLIAYLHILSIIGLFVVLFIEAVLLKPIMTNAAVKLMGKVDGFYGLLSVLVLLTGGIRLFYYGKGSEYYLENSVFLIKLALFTAIGLLSIYPSILFYKLRKNNDDSIVLKKHSVLKIIIYSEIVILISIPLLAVLLANGYDFFR